MRLFNILAKEAPLGTAIEFIIIYNCMTEGKRKKIQMIIVFGYQEKGGCDPLKLLNGLQAGLSGDCALTSSGEAPFFRAAVAW